MSLDFILFDLDGVLVDSRRPISSCLNAALESAGYAPEPEEQLYRFIGPPLATAFEQILQERGERSGDIAAMIATYRERYAELSLRESAAMPGMRKLLQQLQHTFALGVATAKPEKFAIPILQQLSMADYFAAISGPPLINSHLESKATTVARARKILGQERGKGVIVGDRAVDIFAGRANGLHCVSVAWGIGSAAELMDADPDSHVTTPEELASWIWKQHSSYLRS